VPSSVTLIFLLLNPVHTQITLRFYSLPLLGTLAISRVKRTNQYSVCTTVIIFGRMDSVAMLKWNGHVSIRMLTLLEDYCSFLQSFQPCLGMYWVMTACFRSFLNALFINNPRNASFRSYSHQLNVSLIQATNNDNNNNNNNNNTKMRNLNVLV
jgi:hypothetical protein